MAVTIRFKTSITGGSAMSRYITTKNAAPDQADVFYILDTEALAAGYPAVIATHKTQNDADDNVDMLEESDADSYPPRCVNPTGHEFHGTGTAYGGDDERWHGEGRMLCVHCGADGDA